MNMVITVFAIATILSMITTFGLMAFSIDLEARGKRGQLSERVDTLASSFGGINIGPTCCSNYPTTAKSLISLEIFSLMISTT